MKHSAMLLPMIGLSRGLGWARLMRGARSPASCLPPLSAANRHTPDCSRRCHGHSPSYWEAAVAGGGRARRGAPATGSASPRRAPPPRRRTAEPSSDPPPRACAPARPRPAARWVVDEPAVVIRRSAGSVDGRSPLPPSPPPLAASEEEGTSEMRSPAADTAMERGSLSLATTRRRVVVVIGDAERLEPLKGGGTMPARRRVRGPPA